MTLAVAGAAWGQAAGKKPAADPVLAECVASNRQSLVELTQALEEARRRHITSPLIVTRLHGVQAQLGKLREGLPRSGRSLTECETTALALITEKEKLQRIAGEGAPASGEMPVAAVLAAPGRTAAASAEAPSPAAAPVLPNAAPAVLAPPPAAAEPSPQACREDQIRVYNELAQAFATVARSRPSDRSGQLSSLSERLTQLRTLIVDPAAPGWNCTQVNQRLAQIRSDLQPLATTPPK